MHSREETKFDGHVFLLKERMLASAKNLGDVAESELSDAALVLRIRDGIAAAARWPDSVFSMLARLDHIAALSAAASAPETPEAEALTFARALFELARRVDAIEPQPRADLLALLWRPPAEFARRARPLLMRTRPELETMRTRHHNWVAAAKTRAIAREQAILRVTVEVAKEDAPAVRAFARELNEKRGLAERRPERKAGRPPKNPPKTALTNETSVETLPAPPAPAASLPRSRRQMTEEDLERASGFWIQQKPK